MNRFEKAFALHAEGYNCAQAVIGAYADIIGIGEQEAFSIGAGFGGGAGTGELCGAVSGAVMVLGLFPAVSAAPTGLHWEKSDVEVSWDRTDRLIRDEFHSRSTHKPTDLVRVSIVLEDAPTIQAGYATMDIGSNAEAMAYDRNLNKIQKVMEKTISLQALDGKALDVVWNLTLVSNIISANVPYGKIEAIKAIDGVRDVVLERQYETTVAEKVSPNMYTSAGMIGSAPVWAAGMTGWNSSTSFLP